MKPPPPPPLATRGEPPAAPVAARHVLTDMSLETSPLARPRVAAPPLAGLAAPLAGLAAPPLAALAAPPLAALPARPLAVLAVALLVAGCPPSDYVFPGLSATSTGTGDDPPCANGKQDPGEDGIDCGGACEPCPCMVDDECPGGRCDTGHCGPPCDPDTCPPPTCDPDLCPPPPGPCLVPTCGDGGACLLAPADDGSPCELDLCTTLATCEAGVCVPLATRSCGELDGPCRTGVCNPMTGACAVLWADPGAPCMSDPCGAGECKEGLCVASVPNDQTLYVGDFSKPEGWLADFPWEIGPAKPSNCGMFAEDPPDDHSANPDGALAGTLIGACIGPAPIPPSCLTSPPIPIPPEVTPLSLRFWQIASLPPQVSMHVQVLDAMGWQPVDLKLGGDPNEIWTPVDAPLPPILLPEIQLRFCIDSPEPIPPSPGWSIDDIEVIASGCAGP